MCCYSYKRSYESLVCLWKFVGGDLMDFLYILVLSNAIDLYEPYGTIKLLRNRSPVHDYTNSRDYQGYISGVIR